MAESVAELKDALKDAMERNGGLRKLQAHARAEAYRALGAAEVCRAPLQRALQGCWMLQAAAGGKCCEPLQQAPPPPAPAPAPAPAPRSCSTPGTSTVFPNMPPSPPQDAPRPEPSSETLIINELIREYLIWNGLG